MSNETSTGGFPRKGYLYIETFAGQSRSPVTVIGETAKRYRITVETRTKLAGRHRWLEPGPSALVPKYAVDLRP